MQIKRKISIAETSIRSISRHDDDSLDYRVFTLGELKKFIDKEIAEATERERKQEEK